MLQICSEIDKPDPPGPAARNAFYIKTLSLSDEKRNNFEKQFLSITRKQVMDVAKKYFDHNNKNQGAAVISSEEKLTAVNKKLSDNPLKLHKI